jgi:hypothetical protein
MMCQVFIFSLNAAASPVSKAPIGQKIEIKTEGGVTVVRNSKGPVAQPGGPSKLILTQDLVIGKEQNAGSPLFGALRSVGIDDRENIWTLDWEDDKVRVFDKTGRLISTFPILIYCHVMADDRLVWMSNTKYEFSVIEPDGKLVRRIVKDYTPVKVTEADKKAILEERYSDAQFRSQIVFPGEFPPVSFFIGDPEGRLFAQTYETDKKGGWLYDVFDTEGRCIIRFSLPREEMPFVVKEDKLYALIQEDADGIPLVKRYAMEWR